MLELWAYIGARHRETGRIRNLFARSDRCGGHAVRGLLGERIIGADSDFAASQAELLTSLGLPYLDWYADAHDIVEIMKTDKKSRGGKIRFVLVEDVAKWSLVEVDDDILCQALEDYFAFKRDIVDSGSM